MCVCCLIRACAYVDTVQEIGNKGTYVNVKGENVKMPLYLTWENNHDGVILILFSFFFFSPIINNKF
jgi:hypothetical protein